MSLKIKTVTMQEMVSRAIKGASNNKLIPLTGLMSIELSENVLTLTTTDATNYLFIKESQVDGEDFNVTVPVEIFSKLISKLTCETVELNINAEESTLEIVGNGSYLIELPMDENGELIKYPNPIADIEIEKSEEINLSTIQSILMTVKPSLATTTEVPCYTGYYMHDTIIGTDTSKICQMAVKAFNNATLISPEQMDLLAVMMSEKIDVMEKDGVLIYSSPDCIVYGPILEGIDEFAIGPISDLIKQEFASSCKLPKDALLQCLDRLALFVDTYDKNGIYLTFTKDGLQLSSKKSSSIEIISYIDSKDFKDYTCCIDITMLQSQLKALVGDAVELYYGEDNALKLIEGNVTQIIALLEDDRA